MPLGILTYDSGDPFELRRRQATFSPFTYIANITGQPGISLPLAWNADNLPIGIHFLGRYGDEATLLRLSAHTRKRHAHGRIVSHRCRRSGGVIHNGSVQELSCQTTQDSRTVGSRLRACYLCVVRIQQ